MYDDQLTQLDNLISTQHRAQHQMREQLNAVDKRFHKVLLSLTSFFVVQALASCLLIRNCICTTCSFFFLFPQKRFCCPVFSFICIIACAYAYACLLFICVSTVIQKLEDGLWWSFWTVNEWRWLLIRDCIPYPGTIFCIESARWSCCELVFFTLAHFRLPCETSGIAWKKDWHFAAAFYCFLVKLIKYFYFISFVWLILYYHYWWNKDDQKVFLPGQRTLLKTFLKSMKFTVTGLCLSRFWCWFVAGDDLAGALHNL